MNNQIGPHLEKLRLSCNYSLRKAAKLSGLSHGYIRDVELGVNRKNGQIIIPMPQTLQKFADAYGASYCELMIYAGHVKPSDVIQQTYKFVELDLQKVLYVQVDDENKINYHLTESILIEEKSLHDYMLLEEKLEQHKFIRVHSGVFINLKQVRYFDEKSGRIYFNVNCEGKHVDITWMCPREYRNSIKCAIAKNNHEMLLTEPSVFTLIRKKITQ